MIQPVQSNPSAAVITVTLILIITNFLHPYVFVVFASMLITCVCVLCICVCVFLYVDFSTFMLRVTFLLCTYKIVTLVVHSLFFIDLFCVRNLKVTRKNFLYLYFYFIYFYSSSISFKNELIYFGVGIFITNNVCPREMTRSE